MLRISNLSKSFGTTTVLNNASLLLGRGQKAGLVGDNGVGKSTLIKTIVGIEQPDSGKITFDAKDPLIGYMPQELPVAENQSVLQYLKKTTGISLLEERLRELENGDLSCPEKLEEYGDFQNTFERLNGYEFEAKAEYVLDGLGLSINIDRDISSLSSGQKTKLAISGILLRGVDLLLLDEPTNNLDLSALIWIEEFIKSSETTCLIISHDRKFFDKVVRKIFEIDSFTHEIIEYTGNYSDYLLMKQRAFRQQMTSFEQQQEEVGRLSKSLSDAKYRARMGAFYCPNDNDKYARGYFRDRAASSAKKAKAIEKRILQMDRVEKPKERKPLRIVFDPWDLPRDGISLSDVAFSRSSGFSLSIKSLRIKPKDRVLLLGSNGAGKSTVLDIIMGRIVLNKGDVAVHSSLTIGDFQQEHQSLKKGNVVFDTVKALTNASDEAIHHVLANFNITEEIRFEKIENLSPGQRARVLLSTFQLNRINTLVLDEPTNHLDLEAVTQLEETLCDFPGILIMVSHDRAFIENIHYTRTLLITDGCIKELKDYTEYEKQLEGHFKPFSN